jgi:prepilin-type N-terminal cleavage/methylation domain-containing protein
MMNEEKGFTLIEILVVLIVLSLIISMTILHPRALFNKHIEGYAMELANVLREVRFKQLSNQDQYNVQLGKEGDHYRIKVIRLNEAGEEIIEQEVQLKKGYEIWHLKDEFSVKEQLESLYTVSFNKSNGQVIPSDLAGTYYVKGVGTEEKKVVVWPLTGRVVIE